MSVHVLYYKVTPEQINSAQLSELINNWTKGLAIAKQQKIAKLHNVKDQLLSLAGLQLLKTGMANYGDPAFSLQQLHFPEHAKPALKNRKTTIDFNISHSGDIACCVIATNMQVGIDIEQHREVNPNLVEKYFKTKKSYLDNAAKTEFFRFWTKNEAIIKAANLGSVYNIQDIKPAQDGGRYHNTFWYTYELDIPCGQDPDSEEGLKEYSCHIACSDKIQNSKIITSEQLFQL